MLRKGACQTGKATTGMNVSVIVCTRNRGNGLVPCLERLEEMEVTPGLAWELVIVDNGSTDDTASAVRGFAEKSRLDVRYLFEGRPGLSHARNTGIAAATGDVIAFTDDDCMVDGSWLATIEREFQGDRGLAGLGGRVELFDARDKPITITTSKERQTLSLSHDVELAGFINGCNMAFSRAAFEEVGPFDTRLGAGTRIASGEDSDFLYRLLKSGLKVIYVPDVLVYHNHGRRTDAEVEKLMKGYAIGRGAFYSKHIMKRDTFILKSAYWEIRSLVRAVRTKEMPKERRKKARFLLRHLFTGFTLYCITAGR